MTGQLESALLWLKEQLGHCENVPDEAYNTLQQALWQTQEVKRRSNMQLEEIERHMEANRQLRHELAVHKEYYEKHITELKQQIFDEGAGKS